MIYGSNPLRFHVLAIPHTITQKQYSACAFTQKVLKFCKMMHTRGHIVYHYGHVDSDVECTEHVSITDNALLQETYGHYDWKREFFHYNNDDLCYRTFQERAITEIGKRKQKADFLLLFWGLPSIATAHPDLIAVEPGIGCFNTPCTQYSIFESYSVMNYVYGKEGQQPKWYDAVIPNYFDLDDFVFSSKSGDYFVYLGRIIECKGLEIAVRIANATGMRLKVAGQGDFKVAIGCDPPDYVDIIGYVEPVERAILLQGARALIAPSYYNEPFGGVTIEALLCGTPIITTDWGAFAENNLHGITGYRCRTMEQFIWAGKNVHLLDRHICREFAERNFSLERIRNMYEEYFYSLLLVYNGNGFYEKNPDRQELDWLKRHYPPFHDTK